MSFHRGTRTFTLPPSGQSARQCQESIVLNININPQMMEPSWRSALMPEVQDRYRMLKTARHSRQHTSGMTSNFKSKLSPEYTHRRQSKNSYYCGKQSQLSLCSRRSQEEHHGKSRLAKYQSQLSTMVSDRIPTREETQENKDKPDEFYSKVKIQYMEEELKYLRDKFLKHYQTKKCAQIYEPILEEENPQPSFEKPQRIEERNPSENHS